MGHFSIILQMHFFSGIGEAGSEVDWNQRQAFSSRDCRLWIFLRRNFRRTPIHSAEIQVRMWNNIAEDRMILIERFDERI